jgi:ABC-type branched-subunit amino acid transport system substrate-binding protein
LVNCLAASLLTVAVAGCGGSVPPVQPEAQAEPEPAPQPETFVARKVEVVPVDGTETVVTTAEQYLPVFREPGVVRIGFLAPLSGPRGALGQALLNAAQIALFDHAGDGVQLLPRDTRGQTAGATEAMNQLIAEGVDMVIGPLLGGAVRSVAPIARPARIPVVAFSNDKTTAGDGIFVMGFTPAQQVDRVIERAARDGYTRFAALVPRNAYGDVVVEALYRSVEDQAAAVAHIEYYRPGTVSSEEGSAPVQRLVTAANLDADGVPYGYDALLVAAGGTTLRTLAPLLPYYDLDPERVKFLGTQLWNDRAILGEPALLNGWFAAPPEDRFAIFAERYRNAFGSTPPRLASLGYDAVTLASSLAALPGDGDFSDAALTDPAGFTGVDGAFRFGEDGIVERSLAVYRVAPRSFDVLDPAAENFGGTSF